MTGAIRAEILRSVSGLTLLALIGLAGLVPVVVLTSGGDATVAARDLPAAEATLRLVAPLGWSFVAAGFAGAYTVTREQYYGSLERTTLMAGRRRALVAKSLGGAATATLLTATLCAAWCFVMAALLAANGSSFVLSPAVGEALAGSLVGAAIGAIGGCAIGWIVRNYYAAAAIVLGGPLAFELLLLSTNPDVVRWSPGLAIAAIAVPGYRDALLDRPAAVVVALAWILGVSVIASLTVERRTR